MIFNTKRSLERELNRLNNYKKSIELYGFTNSKVFWEAKERLEETELQIKNVTISLNKFKPKK